MKRSGLTLLELMMILTLFGTLSAILLPLTKGMIEQGQSSLSDTGLRVDRLVRDLRIAAHRGWFMSDSAITLGEMRLQNDRPSESNPLDDQWGLLVNGELFIREGFLEWKRTEKGHVKITLYAPQRQPLSWTIMKRYERFTEGEQ